MIDIGLLHWLLHWSLALALALGSFFCDYRSLALAGYTSTPKGGLMAHTTLRNNKDSRSCRKAVAPEALSISLCCLHYGCVSLSTVCYCPPPLAQLAESPCQRNSPSHYTAHLTAVPSDITLLSQPTLFAVILPLDEYCLVSTVAQLSRSNVVASIRFKSIRTQPCSLLLPRSSLALLTISLCCQAELN